MVRGGDGNRVGAWSIEDGTEQWTADLPRLQEAQLVGAGNGLVFVSAPVGSATTLVALGA